MTSATRIAVLLAISGIPAIAQIQPCNAAQLSATEDRREADEIDGGLGHQAMTIVIQNRSASRCVLDGVPAVLLTDHADNASRVAACPNCIDYLFGPQPVAKITLTPNGSAYVVLGYLTECRSAATLRFQLSDQHAGLRIAIAGVGSCGELNVTPFLAKPPVDGFLPAFVK